VWEDGGCEAPSLEESDVIFQILIGELPYLLEGAGIALTLLAALLGLGFVFGIVLAILEVYGDRFSSILAAAIEFFFRGVPAIVLLFLFYYGLSSILDLSPFAAAVLALGLRSGAYQSQIFKGAFQSIASGQMLAAQTLGMSKIKAVLYIILPQAMRFAIGPWSSQFCGDLKATSFAYLVGVSELLRRGSYIVAYTYGNALTVYGFCALIYLILTRAGTMILYRLEDRLCVPGFERRGT